MDSVSITCSAQCGAIAIVGPQSPPVGGMALQAQALVQRLRSESIPTYFIPTNPAVPAVINSWKGIKTLIQSVVYIIRLFQILPRVTVVHVLGASFFYFFARLMPAIVIARVMGKRVILNYRGGAGPSFFSRFGWAAWPVVRMADLVTVPSAYLERCFTARKIPCRVIPNLIDLQKFKFRRRDVRKARLLVNRNLEPMYNIEMALKAFELVKKEFPQARLEIIGSGSEEDSLKKWVAERGLTNVFFHGAVPHERMPEFLDQADVLLNPTLVDNLPMSLLEAFASGLPVVTTNVGGIPDLMGQSGAALLVDPNDHRRMAEEIRNVLSNPGLVNVLASRGSALAETFTWPAVRRRLFEAYYPSYSAPDFIGAEAEAEEK